MRHRQTIAPARRLSSYLVHRETRERLLPGVAAAVCAVRRTVSRIGTVCAELTRRAETAAPARSRRSSLLSLPDRCEACLSFDLTGLSDHKCRASTPAVPSGVALPQHIKDVGFSGNHRCLPWAQVNVSCRFPNSHSRFESYRQLRGVRGSSPRGAGAQMLSAITGPSAGMNGLLLSIAGVC
jgi:hypothetical protein